MAILVARFHELDQRFKHPGRRDSAEQRRLYSLAQTELFNIVQALVGLAHSCVQRDLTKTRQEIVAQLHAHLKSSATGAAMRQLPQRIPLRWYEIQLSPEITIDPSLLGNAVLPEDLKKLKQQLRAQHALIKGLLSGR